MRVAGYPSCGGVLLVVSGGRKLQTREGNAFILVGRILIMRTGKERESLVWKLIDPEPLSPALPPVVCAPSICPSIAKASTPHGLLHAQVYTPEQRANDIHNESCSSRSQIIWYGYICLMVPCPLEHQSGPLRSVSMLPNISTVVT